MSIQTSNASGQTQMLALIDHSTILDRPRALLRQALVGMLKPLDRAISAELDLVSALGDSGKCLFDPALSTWRTAAENAWDRVADRLVDLRSAAALVPLSCPMRQMAVGLDLLLESETPEAFRAAFQFSEQIARDTQVSPDTSALARDGAQVISAIFERMQTLAELDVLGGEDESTFPDDIPGMEMF